MSRLALIFGLFGCLSRVYGAHEFVPLQEKAQGQALVGASTLNDSLYSNPAGAAFTQVYTLEGAYALPKSFALSVLDTKSSSLGAGLGYFRRLEEGAKDPVQGLKLNVLGKATEWAGIGVGGKIMWGPDGQGGKANLKDIDAGILVRLLPVHLGLTFRNIFGGDARLGQGPEWAFGGSLSLINSFFINAAVLGENKSFKPYQYGFGFEYVSQYYFSIKGGYRFQPDRHLSFWTSGLSFNAPKISFHYSVEFPNEAGKKAEHLIGTTILL